MKLDRVGRVSSESVEKNTGRSWDAWVSLLKRAGAESWPHKEIVLYLKSKYKLGPWWQQGVASGFEIAIGRKIEGRSEKGLYSVAGSRTFPMRKGRAWSFMTSDEAVAIWLKPLSPVTLKAGETFENEGVEGGGAFGEIRVVTTGDKIRFRWQENDWEKPSTCVLGIIPRPGEKCMIVFAHDGLPHARVKEEFRAYWKATLESLIEVASQRVADKKPRQRKSVRK